ncbi:uncharacterized protein CANTADRAFT_20557 [Suhomyces tanzawaensis NRRL Y-17324]|uniref:Ubiquitin-activating enzyme E1-like n=1 Tax=Suhomyces tanzawaensis NRRL Y-17324 TaxID=984487 RepID=A0A1E4SNE2_9ASCO|nr:uncharacterized protein CANTADRAFT_20557 [Suhomyces tanzawaensis NRRL Y-17324]ODV81008.1 hypothetical protein CANTADRAFT_20557 [Suhomyces tanzawaensis NRRL Y-17324]
MAKDTYLKKILGNDRYSRVRQTKILMVGAGGIGCELLKDLVLTGYGEIHIVDLDTITLSNLNRQFLFRHHDIDKSKSLTVAKAVDSFNYFDTKLVPHHGNIMDAKQFPITWWSQFSYIFNALDNLEARRYVNRMCLYLKTPLMESGTTGFDGQIQPIYPYYSECFDCQSKVTPKTFPVCTIRSTPSQPVHCITWAKEFLFHQLFDEVDSSAGGLNDAAKIKSETDDKDEIENMTKEFNELVDLRKLIFNSDARTFFTELVNKIFKVDVERLLLIETLWKSRQKPVPLIITQYEQDLIRILDDQTELQKIFGDETKVWSTLENLVILFKASESLQRRLQGEESFLSFDKDDEDTLNFVTASANLRSIIFNIEVKSKFDIKQIAGNIIPAIATTNAIISGFSSLSGTNYFKYDFEETQDFSRIYQESSSIFISIKPNKYITSASLVGPNERCPTSSIARGLLKLTPVEVKELSLKWLVDKLIEQYDYADEAVALILGKSRLIYDVDFDDNLEKRLGDLSGFTDGELLMVQDDDGELESIELYISIVEDHESDYLPQIKLGPKKAITEESSNGSSGAPDVATDTIVIDEEDEDLVEVTEPVVKKRKIEVEVL